MPIWSVSRSCTSSCATSVQITSVAAVSSSVRGAVVTVGQNQHRRHLLDATCCDTQDVKGRAVGPMAILHHNDDRSPLCHGCEQSSRHRCRIGHLRDRIAERRGNVMQRPKRCRHRERLAATEVNRHARRRREGSNECRLADSRLADNRDDLAPSLFLRPLKRGPQRS